MRINIVTGPFHPFPPAPCGAVERGWSNLSELFVARGHDVTVLCRHWPGQALDESSNSIRFIRRTQLKHTRFITWDLVQDFYYSLRMLRLLPPADVTVTNVFWLPWLIRTPAVGKVVVKVGRWPKGQMMLYRRAARIITGTTAMKQEIVRQCPDLSEITTVIPNSINPAIMYPPEKPRATRAGAGTILYVGRVHPEKGLHLLVDAFVGLMQEFSELKLKIVGDWAIDGGGGGEDYLRYLRQRAGKTPVEFAGPIHDRTALADELRAADYFCYPSIADRGEAFGAAPLEAMATGLAPVVSGLPVFRDFITHGENGIVFDHHGAAPIAGLTRAIRTLITDPKRAASLGLAAQLRAADFARDRIADLYLSEFQGMIEKDDSYPAQPITSKHGYVNPVGEPKTTGIDPTPVKKKLLV